MHESLKYYFVWFSQENQSTIYMLNEVWKEIKPKADQESKEMIEDQIEKINDQWNTLVADLDTRREKLTELAEQWENVERALGTSEGVLKQVETDVEQCDVVVHSADVLTRNKAQLEVRSFVFCIVPFELRNKAKKK